MSSKTTPIFLILLAAIVGYIAYQGLEIAGVPGLALQKGKVVAIQDTITKLEGETDKAKKELAKGTVEDLRKKLETYRSSLALLRRLVPDRNEVPNLLDDISTRSKIRGVTLSQVVPQPVEAGPAPFDTYKYTLSVIGHYDQIGEWLADVASLQRIIVPQEVSLSVANQSAAKALGDTSGALLEAKLEIRTFVKSGAGAPEGETSGT
jgi:type IV pilus assembly protein PilO